MKHLKLLAGLAAAVLIAAPAVLAQSYPGQYHTQTVFTVVAAQTTTNFTSPTVFGVTKFTDVAIWVHNRLGGTGTDVSIANFSKSVDGTTYETTPSVVVTNINNGTTAVDIITNINVGAAGFLRLTSLVNADTGDVLSNTVSVAFKPQQEGR